jgi:flagellar hook-basal body complex protein FliE
MNIVSSVYSGAFPPAAVRIEALREKAPLNPAGAVGLTDELAKAQPSSKGFASMLEGLVEQVGTKQAEANALTQRVLTGETDQLHQSVIAMQEASVSFSLMVEVRNKLVESYQELMRLQV